MNSFLINGLCIGLLRSGVADGYIGEIVQLILHQCISNDTQAEDNQYQIDDAAI